MEELAENLQRIFWGGSSWGLILELFFRTLVLYLYAFFLVRIIGKRGLSSLAPFELAVIVVLGSVLGGPMLDPEMPLIYGIVVLTVIVGLQRLFVHLTEHNRLFEHLLESDPSRLVKDGVMDVKNMHKEGFSRDDLFLSLRDKGIEHLGEVKGAFLETSGKVSVWTRSENEVEPGLPLIPIVDKDCPIPFPKGDSAKMAEYCSCSHCGYTLFFHEDEKFCECPNCHSECWIPSSMQRARELEKNALS